MKLRTSGTADHADPSFDGWHRGQLCTNPLPPGLMTSFMDAPLFYFSGLVNNPVTDRFNRVFHSTVDRSIDGITNWVYKSVNNFRYVFS